MVRMSTSRARRRTAVIAIPSFGDVPAGAAGLLRAQRRQLTEEPSPIAQAIGDDELDLDVQISYCDGLRRWDILAAETKHAARLCLGGMRSATRPLSVSTVVSPPRTMV